MEYDLGDEEMRGGEMEMENGPTFEDLAIDDSLTDMERVAKYVCSNIALQRVIHVKMLEDTANSVGFETTCDQLIPLLEPLVCDVEYVVRQHVAFQFPPLCRFLVEAGGDVGYKVLLDKMIPLISRLMSDPQHEVRSAASDSLVEMAALVKSEDQGQHVLTIVLPLAHEDDNEQFRISAVSLYNGLAEHLGPELCQQFCVPELISLSEDPVFRVRKFTAQSFSNVCKTAGQELSRERLLPAFLRLAKDDIWGVRKACAESLVGISEALAPEDRGELLVPLFESFVNDSSRWVRIAAFQNLGPFLATLERQDVTDALLEHFLNMASSSSAQFGASGEVEIKYHCAFSFPAIVSILGESGWSKISATFEALSNDAFWKIRRTFAHSLHELAKILGQEITEKHLATAFDGYLHDVHDVKLGAMLHFADFLQALSPSFRESYLPVLSEFDSFDQITKWRFREVLCVQLDQLCLTFTPEATFSVVYPLVFKLITDDVAAVRRESFHACPLLLARLQSKPEWVEDVINKFCSLAKSTRYTDRQIYVKVCDAFLSSPEEDSRAVFAKHLATAFFALSADPVSNVRQMFAVEILKHRDVLLALDECPASLRQLVESDSALSSEDLSKQLKPENVASATSSSANSPAAPTPASDDAVSPPPAPTEPTVAEPTTDEVDDAVARETQSPERIVDPVA